MSWLLRSIGHDKFELVLSDEPSYIHALQMAPDCREPELDLGLWLLVVFPVWSSPVRQSVRAALACAIDHAGKFQLGIRPFNSHEEISKWWPLSNAPSPGQTLIAVSDEPSPREIHISTDPTSYPIWLVFRDASVVHQGRGPRTEEHLSQLMQTVLD